jgi:branched-chain amino acid transport system substrate-binding protein
MSIIVIIAMLTGVLPVISAPISVASATDGALEVVCVPWKGTESRPHPTYTGKEITLKGTARCLGGGEITYEWDFGDGSPPETSIVWVGDDYPYPISARHAYVGPPGTLYVATLTVSTWTESATDLYLIQILPLDRQVEADISIDEGLWWLYQEQNRYTQDAVDLGSWGGWARVANTGAAVQAFENNLHKPFGDPSIDPYVDCVRRGLHFCLSMAYPVAIPPGDPYGGDTNGNGIGIACHDWMYGGREMYEIGIAMMAMVSSDTPGRVAVTGPADVIGRTYFDIVQDMADYCAWGQNDDIDVTVFPGIYQYQLSTGSTSQVTMNWWIHEEWPGASISGDRIVWMDRRDIVGDEDDADIYMYDLATGTEITICDEPDYQYHPSISGDGIVWADDRDGNRDIYMYDLATGLEMPVCTDPATQDWPDISGNLIVWSDWRDGDLDIYAYDLSTGTEIPVTTDIANQYIPAISGDIVTWTDDRNDSYDIFMYDLSTGMEIPVCVDPADLAWHIIDGDRIVWVDYRNDDGDIYMYDLATGVESPICTVIGDQDRPVIFGDTIVWQDRRNGKVDPDIYAYDLATGSEIVISLSPAPEFSPDVSGDNIIWVVPQWGQIDENRVGGWRYSPNYGTSDNSVTQWPIMGLGPAETRWGIEVADFVRPRLEGWLTHSQTTDPNWCHGGSGYMGPGDCNVARTAGTGIPGLAFCGVLPEDERIQNALAFLDRAWSEDNFGNEYAMYAVKKCFEEFLPMEYIGGHNWWDEYVDFIVPLQAMDGHWDVMGDWSSGNELTTAWMILILSPGVVDVPPEAVAKVNGFDYVEVDKDQIVFFDGLESERHTYEIVKYEWDFGDGTPPVEGITATHAYTDYGEYTVTLTVTDNRDVVTGGALPPMSDYDECTVVVHPPPHAPIADANDPYIGWVGVAVTLDGSGSWDPNEPPFGDDQVISWHWDLDNDGEFDDASGETVEHTWDEPGIYPIALMVDAIDEPLWSEEPSRTVVEIGNHNPIADPNGPYLTTICTPIVLSGCNSYDPDEPVGDSIVIYEWDLDNDGDYDDATGHLVEFHSCDEGAYTVGLRVTDTFGASDSARTTVTVAPIVGPYVVKSLSQHHGLLGDHIMVDLIVVNPGDLNVTLVDVLPSDLTYITSTFMVDGVAVMPDIGKNNTLSIEIVSGVHTVNFEVQVTEVQSEIVSAVNCAHVVDAAGIQVAESCDAITLYPYHCFVKEAVTAYLPDSTEIDPYVVPAGEKVTWLVLIDVGNCPYDDVEAMEDVVIKDNLGGNLALQEWVIQRGDASAKTTGKTKKVHLSWDVGDIADGEWVGSDMWIHTDLNPAGKQEYTDQWPTEHELNSGATLKFTDPSTGFQLSAHTGPILVETVVPTYKVGAVFGLTGPLSYAALAQKQTVEMMVDEINTTGGIDGRPLEAIIYDTLTDSATCIAMIERLIGEDGVAAIIGPTTSGETLASVATVTAAGVPLVSCGSSIHNVTPIEEREWVFKTPPSSIHSVDKLFSYLQAQGFVEIAILTENSAYGAIGRETMLAQAPAYGLSIVADEIYGRYDPEVYAQLIDIASTPAEAVVCWGTEPGTATVAINMQDLGMTIPLFMSFGVSRSLIDLAAEAANGIIFTGLKLLVAEQLPPADPQKAVLLEYKAEYESRYGEGTVSTFGGHAADALSLVVMAMDEEGSNSGKIREQLENISDYAGITGVFNMSPLDHNGLTAECLVIIEIVDGEFVLREL